MKKLNQTQLDSRNFWFKNIFFKLVSVTDPATFDFSNYSIANTTVVQLQDLINAAKELKEIIVDLKMNNCNNALATIAKLTCKDPATSNFKSFTVTEIAEFIASFCQQKQIYFDDYVAPTYSPQAINAFKTQCYLGIELVNFDCFISQNLNTAASNKLAGVSNGGTKSVSKLNRSNAGGILSPQKEIITQAVMYWIGGDRFDPAKTNCPRVHVKPCNHTAPLQVHYSSGQGWDECILFFKTSYEANVFLNKCNNDPKKPAKAQNLTVKKFRTDMNGYIKVSTEFGDAYVYAKKLHESREAFLKKMREEFIELKSYCYD